MLYFLILNIIERILPTSLKKTAPSKVATSKMSSSGRADVLKGMSLSPLSPLKDCIQSRSLSLYTKLFGGDTAFDALIHLPREMIEARHIPYLSPEHSKQQVIVQVEIIEHIKSPRPGQPTRVRCRVLPSQDTLDLVFFMRGRVHQYILGYFSIGRTLWVSGKLEMFLNMYQISHPTKLRGPSECEREVVYPLVAGLNSPKVGRLIRLLLDNLMPLPEWHNENYTYPNLIRSLHALHSPKSNHDLSPESVSRLRLLHDELLAHQLALHLSRQKLHLQGGIAINSSGELEQKITSDLPFTLTSGQTKALFDVYEDMKKPHPMLRLVQGDVGCGKTLVAALALANTVEAGYQGAFLAPTDLLAQQHVHSLTQIFSPHGVQVALLTGKIIGKKRQEILQRMSTGDIHILVGTHALIQESVQFKNLALAVIDEQHRFGVEQRAKLVQKGIFPHLLSMTATPIPRTLQMTLMGDLDVTTIMDKPANRKPIHTSLHNLSKVDEILQKLHATLSSTHKAYWVCPLIEESEVSDLAAATMRYEVCRDVLGDRVALLHGRLKQTEKEAIMDAFKNGEVQLLISTTVIEVGVDVKTANIMIIEHAERFGLAQLHQLRGRVGRSDTPSHCLLLYEKLTEVARKRLYAMRESNDGFYLSEVDLSIRGSGDVMGLKQSGFPSFRFFPTDRMDIFSRILRLADQDARHYAQTFHHLPKEKQSALEFLLSLYKKGSPDRFKRSG